MPIGNFFSQLGNKKPKGNNRSSESQQVQSLDKVIGVLLAAVKESIIH